MIAQNNVTHMYVCADAALATTTAPSTARYMGIKRVGEVLCDASALVAGDQFQILYYDNAGKLQISPMFAVNDHVSGYKVSATSDAAEVVAVGYNGTSGAIEVNNGGEYLVTVGYREGLKQFNKRLYKYGQYTADASATQYEIADGIMDSFLPTLKKDPYKMFKMEKINDGAQLSAIGSLTVAVTNESKVITFSGDASSYVSAGSLLRFGTSGAGTAPVYKVASVTSTTVFVLDQPYQGATAATYAAATVETVTEGNYGLLITAIDSNKPFEVGKWDFNPIVFDVGVSVDFGATPVTVNTVAARGIGTYKDVAFKEWELLGNRREAFRIAEYPLNINAALGATVGETYTMYTIQFKEGSTKTIGGTAESFTTLVICSAGSTLTTALDTALAALL